MPKIHKLWHNYLDWHRYNLTYRCNRKVLLYRDWTNGKDGVERVTMNNNKVTCGNCIRIINKETDFQIKMREKYGKMYFLSLYEQEKYNAKHLHEEIQ